MNEPISRISAADGRHRVSSLDDLAKRYPNVFGTPPRPLRLGAFNTLLAELGPDVDRSRLRKLLAIHTQRRAYLEQVAQGGARYALDGSIDGAVSAKEQAYASDRLAALLAAPAHVVRAARSALLKRFEASGLERRAYAEQHGIAPAILDKDLDRARNERTQRRARRARLVASFRKSGLTIEEFASKRLLSVKQVERAIGKVQALEALSAQSAPESASSTPGQ